MNWDRVIERNSEALKRIIAALVAMAGLGASTSPGPKRTLPRHLHTAVLRILRPAESAMRRLIVVASRGIAVTLPPPRPPKEPKAVPVETILRGLGIAVTLPPAEFARAAAAARRAAEIRAARLARPRGKNLPLLDPMKNHFRPRRKFVPPHLGPRVSSPDDARLRPLPPPPSPNDPVDATRIGLRIEALAAALDDLPGQARRFARWQARRDRALAEERSRAAGQKTGQPRPYHRRKSIRIWPLRSGRPPGQHPRNGRKSSRHEVHEILRDLHNLAFDVLEGLDTS